MDETEHPYTIDMTNKDVRITNHYYENDFTSALFSAIHEGGHAIYEQDIPDSLEGTGLNVAASMAIMNLNQDFMKISLERVENLVIIYIMNQLSNLKNSLKEFQKEQFYKA